MVDQRRRAGGGGGLLAFLGGQLGSDSAQAIVYRSESASEQDAQRRREGIYNFFQAALLLLLAEEEGRWCSKQTALASGAAEPRAASPLRPNLAWAADTAHLLSSLQPGLLRTGYLACVDAFIDQCTFLPIRVLFAASHPPTAPTSAAGEASGAVARLVDSLGRAATRPRVAIALPVAAARRAAGAASLEPPAAGPALSDVFVIQK